MRFFSLLTPVFQIFRISGFHPVRGTGEGVHAASPRAVGQAVFFMASLMTSAAQLEALCRVAVDK